MEDVQAALGVFTTKEGEKEKEGEEEEWAKFDSDENRQQDRRRPRARSHFELQWRQEQGGLIRNGCPSETARGQNAYQERGNRSNPQNNKEVDDNHDNWWEKASEGLYWQLYKSLAAFRMAERREKQKGKWQ